MSEETQTTNGTAQFKTPEGIMTVHVGDENSPVYFYGPAYYYNGRATNAGESGRHRNYIRMCEANGGEDEESREERLACYKTTQPELTKLS
jgi:hypothetical protein